MKYLVEIIQTQKAEIIPFFSNIPMIRGRWDYRGTLIHIIDLRDYFGLQCEPEYTPSATRPNAESIPWSDTTKHIQQQPAIRTILVVAIQGHIFGLLVDTVLQVFPLTAFYEYPGMISKLPRRYFAGITTVNEELVILLAIGEFLSNYELDTLLRRIGES